MIRVFCPKCLRDVPVQRGGRRFAAHRDSDGEECSTGRTSLTGWSDYGIVDAARKYVDRPNGQTGCNLELRVKLSKRFLASLNKVRAARLRGEC